MKLPRHALSVRQPWAWAIIHAGKGIENRDWRKPNPGLDFRGDVAIHASIGMTQAEYAEAAAYMASIGVDCPPAARLQRGGIIGVVCVTGITRQHDSPWFFGPMALVLVNPQRHEFVPCKGALGFFPWTRGDGGPLPALPWMTKTAKTPAMAQGELL